MVSDLEVSVSKTKEVKENGVQSFNDSILDHGGFIYIINPLDVILSLMMTEIEIIVRF